MSFFVRRWMDAFFGRGEAAVTVPPMDGPFMHNDAIELMTARARLQAPDMLVATPQGLMVSDGGQVFRLAPDPQPFGPSRAKITALAARRAGGLWLARDGGLSVLEATGQERPLPGPLPAGLRPDAVTAMVEGAEGALFLTTGSARNPAAEWRRDLLERNRSGALWRRDPNGQYVRLQDGLAWAAGVMLDPDGAVVLSESWRHRLLRLRPGAAPEVLVDSLPFYPSRLVAAEGGGGWLGSYAGRGQLIEFVLRQDGYRRRMMAEVPEPWWIGPSFSSGRSYLEPIRGGTVKRMGQTKAWAPSNSYGLVTRLGADLRPRFSLHSRADGRRHGIMGLAEAGGQLVLASRGNGEIVSAPLDGIETLSRSNLERSEA